MESKYGFIDKSGKVVIEPQFDGASNFSEGFAQVEKDDKWGFIDKNGKVVIEPQFDWVSYFSEGWVSYFSVGLARVQKDRKYGFKYGFIDKSGNDVEPFSEGLASVAIES